MEAESKAMHLDKLKRQWTNVCQMENNNRARNGKLLDGLTVADQTAAESRLRIDQLKLIKDHFKDYVMKMWPAVRESHRERVKWSSTLQEPKPEAENHLRLDAGGIEIRLPNSNGPMERKANLSTSHQRVISYPSHPHPHPPLPSQHVKEETETDKNKKMLKSDAYDKMVRTTSPDESSQDGTDVEKQMAAIVTTSAENESSSDESSDSHEIATATAPAVQNTKKLSALHLGLDSDSDELVAVMDEDKKKKKEKDEDDDFTFFD